MSVSDSEREFAWKKQGKGNGLRWLILRDIVAGLSLHPMSLEKCQDYLLMLRGVSWNTSRVMLQELERMSAIQQYKETGIQGYLYRATERGVTIFVKHRRNIPVRIARAVQITTSAPVGVENIKRHSVNN